MTSLDSTIVCAGTPLTQSREVIECISYLLARGVAIPCHTRLSTNKRANKQNMLMSHLLLKEGYIYRKTEGTLSQWPFFSQAGKQSLIDPGKILGILENLWIIRNNLKQRTLEFKLQFCTSSYFHSPNRCGEVCVCVWMHTSGPLCRVNGSLSWAIRSCKVWVQVKLRNRVCSYL